MSLSPKQLENLTPEEKRQLLAELLKQKAEQANITYPLSYGQKALWFLYYSAPHNAAYNFAFTVRIRYQVDTSLLRRLFQILMARHPTLRSTFTLRDGEPVQVVHGYQELLLEEIDASAWNGDKLREHLQRAYQRPFDLENGPVLRVSLLSRSRQDHVLLLTMHHIVCDGWSLWFLLDELRKLYAAEITGIQAALPPLTATYADYVRWQTEMLQSSAGDKLWSYWRDQLAGSSPNLKLPTDRPRPAFQTYHGASHNFRLPAELVKPLNKLKKETGATIFMILLAAFQVLLYRYSGQDDILVGSPTSGRSRNEFAKVFGFFVNPIVLRAKFSENPSFKAFLGQVRQTVLDGIKHQDFPFPLLVQRLRPKRDPSRSPLFQVMFVFQKPQRLGNTADLMSIFEPFELAQREGQFDLICEVVEAMDSLSGTFKYNTDLFNAETIARMSDNFQVLLRGILKNPEQRVSELPLLAAAERRRLLDEWNQTHQLPPGDGCIHHLFEKQVERAPETVAAVFEEEQITYDELNRRANQLAHVLQKLGIGPERPVALCLARSLEMLIGLLAVLKAGGAYLPLDPSSPPERLAYMVADAATAVILTQQQLRENWPDNAAKVIALDADWDRLIAGESEQNLVADVTPDNLAYIIYTSGSTGRPKGVAVEQQQLGHYISAIQHRLGLQPGASYALFQPIHFDMGHTVLFPSLCGGGTLHILSPERTMNAVALRDYFSHHPIDTIKITPSHLAALLTLPEFRQLLPRQHLIFGGEPLPWDLVDKIQSQAPTCTIYNHYGPTETTVGVCCTIAIDPTPYTLHTATVPLGRPLANTQIYILDSAGQPSPIGVAGEICIAGTAVSRGYLNHPRLTAERFIPNPFCQQPDSRLYKSGDLGRYLPDGTIEFIGRVDNQVKIRGFRFEPGEIESVLKQHPGLQEAVVLAQNNGLNDKRLAAFVVPTSLPTPAQDELHSFLKTRLPYYMLPATYTFLEALPLTPHGKVDYRALPASGGYSARPTLSHVKPRTEMERLIASVWQTVLRVEKVSINENFFDLGGHSLLMIQVHTQLQEKLALEFSVVEMFEYTTIQALAKRLSSKKKEGAAASPALDRVDIRDSRRAARRQQRQRRQAHREQVTLDRIQEEDEYRI